MRTGSKTTAMTPPQCRQCGERDRVVLIDGYDGTETAHWFCDRCVTNVAASSPSLGRHTPDDIGPPITPRKRRARKSSTNQLVKVENDRTAIRKVCLCGHDWLAHPFNGTERSCVNATCQCQKFVDAATASATPDGRAAP